MIKAPDLSGLLNCGIFWHPQKLGTKKRERMACERLTQLAEFYSTAKCAEVLLPLICGAGAQPVVVDDAKSQRSIGGYEEVSLRALDWLVINYAKKFRITYTVTPVNKKTIVFDVFNEYKMCLMRYKRINFDPFRRGKRVFFSVDNKWYETTVGQLNFLHWASVYGVLDYARANNAAIVKDHAASMVEHIKLKAIDAATGQTRKRKELSKSADVSCIVHTVSVEIVFERAVRAKV
jgi:hypothetical protein